MTAPVRLFILDDTRLYREGLAHLLERNAEMHVVGTAGELNDALARLAVEHTDVVLCRMATPGNLSSMRILTHVGNQIKVVALGVTETEDEIIACAEAGVAGYLPRDGSIDDLLTTIRSVACGETRCSPRIVATLLRRVAVLADERQVRLATAHLTPREQQIVRLIDGGCSNKEIAQSLQIGVPTVKNHVHNILEKLQVRRRGEAAARLRVAAPVFGGAGNLLRRVGVQNEGLDLPEGRD